MKTMAMNRAYNIHSIWIALMVLTVSTYALGKLGYSGVEVVIFILITAAAKSVLIIRDYMGLRGVSLLWRIIMYGWLLVVIVSIGITYIISL